MQSSLLRGGGVFLIFASLIAAAIRGALVEELALLGMTFGPCFVLSELSEIRETVKRRLNTTERGNPDKLD